MKRYRFTPAGKVNQAYRAGGLIVGFMGTNQAVAVAGPRKMSDYRAPDALLILPQVSEHEEPLVEGPQHLYFALKRRYPECKICLVGERVADSRRAWGQHYPGHELLRKICTQLNNHGLMPLAFAASDYASAAARNRRSREEWLALHEQGQRYGLH